MKPSELIWKAVSHIREVGWIQGSLGGHQEGHCIQGALRCSTVLSPYSWSRVVRLAEEEVNAVAVEQYDRNFITANDQAMQSQSEAIALMEKAAIRLEERGL